MSGPAGAPAPTPPRHGVRPWALVTVGAVFLVLRLYGVTAPLIEMHNVRQTQTAMIARNLLRENFNIFHTRIDWTGNEPGYVVQEFPLYQLIVALAWKIYGEYDAVGRLISLLWACVAAFYLFRIARMLFSPDVALWALAYFAVCPMSVFASRAFMINMMALSLSVVAIYEWFTWGRSGSRISLARGALAITAATLVNLTTVTPAVVVIIAIASSRAFQNRGDLLGVAAAAALFATCNFGWNIHAAMVNRDYYPDWGADKVFPHVFGLGAPRFDPYLWFRIGMYLAYFVVGIHGIVLMGAGTRALKDASGWTRRVMGAWTVGAVAYYVVFFNALRGHNYYSLPIVPLLSILAGVGAWELWSRCATRAWWLPRAGCAIFALTLPLWLFFPLAHSLEEDRISYDAARELQRRSAADDLVLVAVLHTDVASSVFPTILYYADRRGWNIATANSPTIDYEDIQGKRLAGARYLLVTHGSPGKKPVSHVFPLFQYFAHDPKLDARPILAEIKSRYGVVSEGLNYVLVRL